MSSAIARCPTRRSPVSLTEVVEDDDGFATGGEGLRRMTADVAGPAGHEDCAHGRPIEMYVKPSDRRFSGL